ncbi:MAG: YegP family protein [Betaproteobacteria bacterium]|nr:YegP family protein [Betaproteobacteria bacterium]
MAGKYELKQTDKGQFHFNLKAGNGQVIMSSGMFASRTDAEGAIGLARKHSSDDGRFERKTSSKGEAYFVLTGPDGKMLGRSEMYASVSAMENGVASVVKNGPDAATVEVGT